MKKKFLLSLSLVTIIGFAAFAYTSGTIVKTEDDCSRCKPNGGTYICGRCGHNFSRMQYIGETDEYETIKMMHHTSDECNHWIKVRKYK